MQFPDPIWVTVVATFVILKLDAALVAFEMRLEGLFVRFTVCDVDRHRATFWLSLREAGKSAILRLTSETLMPPVNRIPQ